LRPRYTRWTTWWSVPPRRQGFPQASAGRRSGGGYRPATRRRVRRSRWPHYLPRSGGHHQRPVPSPLPGGRAPEAVASRSLPHPRNDGRVGRFSGPRLVPILRWPILALAAETQAGRSGPAAAEVGRDFEAPTPTFAARRTAGAPCRRNGAVEASPIPRRGWAVGGGGPTAGGPSGAAGVHGTCPRTPPAATADGAPRRPKGDGPRCRPSITSGRSTRGSLPGWTDPQRPTHASRPGEAPRASRECSASIAAAIRRHRGGRA